MEPAKRQKLDPLQCILDLDADEFHQEFHRRKNADLPNGKILRRALAKKLATLQDLLYSEEPLPKSPQTYEEIEFRLPRSAELIARRHRGDAASTRVRATEQGPEHEETKSRLDMFLDQRHHFRTIRVYQSNDFIQDCVMLLLDDQALTNLKLEIHDLRFLDESWGEYLDFARVQKLTITNCELANEFQARRICNALTGDLCDLRTLELDGIAIAGKGPARIFLEGIRNSRRLQHLCLSSQIECDDKDFHSRDLAQAIVDNQSITTISGSGWQFEYFTTLLAAMQRQPPITLENVRLDLCNVPPDLEELFEKYLDVLQYPRISNGWIAISLGFDLQSLQSWTPEFSAGLEQFRELIQTKTKWPIDLFLGYDFNAWDRIALNLLLQTLCKRKSAVKALTIDSPSLDAVRFQQWVTCIPQIKVTKLKILWVENLIPSPAFVEALCQNHEITEYEYRTNSSVGDELQAKIAYMLLLNRGGRRIVAHEPVSLSLWPLVLERANRVKGEGNQTTDVVADIVYYLIQRGVSQLVST